MQCMAGPGWSMDRTPTTLIFNDVEVVDHFVRSFSLLVDFCQCDVQLAQLHKK